MIDMPVVTVPAPIPPAKVVVPPAPGEVITSLTTGNTYTMGNQIGEGYFGVFLVVLTFGVTIWPQRS